MAVVSGGMALAITLVWNRIAHGDWSADALDRNFIMGAVVGATAVAIAGRRA